MSRRCLRCAQPAFIQAGFLIGTTQPCRRRSLRGSWCSCEVGWSIVAGEPEAYQGLDSKENEYGGQLGQCQFAHGIESRTLGSRGCRGNEITVCSQISNRGLCSPVPSACCPTAVFCDLTVHQPPAREHVPTAPLLELLIR